MTHTATIIATVEAVEREMRAMVPGPASMPLCPEDYALCIERAAQECGVSHDEARAIMDAHNSTMGAG